MNIIVNGVLHNHYIFECDNCCCEWTADPKEIRITDYDDKKDVPCCFCPECGKWTAGEER